MGSLPVETKSVEELIVDALDDLADAGHPTPQVLGPGFAGVAFGWTENLRPVALHPALMVLFTLKALVVGYIWSRGEGRSHTRQPGVATLTHCEEGLGQWLIFGRGRGETETCYDACGINSDEQAKSLIPSQTIAPSDVGLSSQPSLTPSDLGISDGHRRAVQGLVGRVLSSRRCGQMQGYLLYESHLRAHQPIELRAVGQGRESVVQVGCCVAVKVPLAAEAAPPTKDGESNHLAGAERGIGPARPLLLWAGVAEVVHHDV